MSTPGPAAECVRVMVVDDSAFMRVALTRMINSEAGFEVVGTACSGPDALEKIVALNPDVITLDVVMPVLDGLETLRRIMRRFPRPVIMVSAAAEKDAEITFDALSAGAFDYVPKQLAATSIDIDHIRLDLIAKIRAASAIAPSRKDTHSRKPVECCEMEYQSRNSPTAAVVVIGTSTGGPQALEEILPRLPHDLPVPLFIVQHMPRGFTAPFAHRLDELCDIAVREAVDGELARPGVAYIAPAGIHMTLVRRLSDSQAIIVLERQPECAPHIPSADVLMSSAAAAFQSRTMGVIMTGMGSDGAEGIRAIYQQGGLTIGQDESSCAVYGMPKVCAELGVLTSVVPLSEIPSQILFATLRRKHA